MRVRPLFVTSVTLSLACGGGGTHFGGFYDGGDDDAGDWWNDDSSIGFPHDANEAASTYNSFPDVTGLFVASPPESPPLILTAAAVQGVVLDVDWSDFDLGDPKTGHHTSYDFSMLDNIVLPWLAAGKRISFSMRATPDAPEDCPIQGTGSRGLQGIGNCAVPAWMWTALSSTNTASCNGMNVPNFIGKPFTETYKPAIAALLDHYAPLKAVSYVRVGFGMNRGIGLPSGWDDTSTLCGDAFTNTWGYTVGPNTQATWSSYVLTMVQYVGLIPSSTKRFMVNLSSVATTNVGPNVVPDYVASMSGLYTVGFGSEGLAVKDVAGDPACSDDWCDLFASYKGKTALALRPADHTLDDFTSIVPFAVSHHVNALEIDYADWLVAYDATNPYYATYGASYRAALEAAASAL